MRIKLLVCFAGTFLFLASPACAATGVVHKLWRGVVNIASAPLEIPKGFRKGWIDGSKKTPHIIVWLVCGTVEGSVNTVKRLGSGVWDVVSFPVAVPADYQAIYEPEYVLQNWPQR